MGKARKPFIASCIAFMVAAIIIYTVVVPAFIVRQYNRQLYSSALPLRTIFNDLVKSTDLPLLSNSSASYATKMKNAATVKHLVSYARQELQLLSIQNDAFYSMPYSDALGRYGKAFVLHDHAIRMIGQCKDAMSEYIAMITYLETFYKTVDTVTLKLSDFNKVTDLNEYSGQYANMQGIARDIRVNISELNNIVPPHDLKGANDAIIAAYEEAAAGFDDLAYGLMLPADDPIYTAAIKIESATRSVEKVTYSLDTAGVEQTRAIKDIHDFTEKLDLILES